MCLPVLNLLNFELPVANKCKYVLTSPRSLKACRRAGVKPVELLYKSLSDVENEAGSKEEAQMLFETYEVERQRKLALCRALRNELLLYGYWSPADINYKTEKIKRYSPKSRRDSKEHCLPAITGSYLMKRAETPENMRRLKDRAVTTKTCVLFPKVNISFEDARELKPPTIEEEESCLDTVVLSRPTSVVWCGLHKIEHLEHSGIFMVPLSLKDIRATHRCDVNASQIINNSKEHGNNVVKTTSFPNSDAKTIQDLKLKELNGEVLAEEMSINDFDLVPNKLNKDKEFQKIIDNMNNCRENINNLIQQEKYTSMEDINNNHIKVKNKRSNSMSRKKSKESKKKMKEVDFKKALEHMKIQYSDPGYCTYKYKQVIENSVERDLRELEVQRVQRELEAGMERWQDRVLLLQWLDVARAREQASRELEMRVERLQQKNRAKNIIHTMNINKVREAEDMKAEGLRRQVQEKERRIFNLHQEKERIIYESKNRALSIQELKDQIRSIMTPETFDKKVAKLSMHKKVLDTQMCARIMQRSHIWLG